MFPLLSLGFGRVPVLFRISLFLTPPGSGNPHSRMRPAVGFLYMVPGSWLQ